MNPKIASALFGLLALAFFRDALGADLPTLRVASDDGRLNHLALVITQKQGFFTKHGVRVEVIRNAAAGGDSNSRAALKGYEASIERGGRADMSIANGGFFINAVLNGSEAIGVGVMTANPVYQLIVRPEIRSYADLKGKTVTMTATWDGVSLTGRALLAKHGLGPRDFTFEGIRMSDARLECMNEVEGIRMSDARLECMNEGRCAAILAGQPNDTEALDLGRGYHSLGTTLEAGPVTFYMEVVRRQWAEANRDTLVRYLRAKGDAMAFIHDPKNRAALRQAIAEVTGYPAAVVDRVAASYSDPSRRILPRRGELDPASFNNLLQFAKDAGLWDKPWPPAERFYDLSYARAAGIQ
jgi:ABC-type nitrate/sulfonate/bicarbonate transport system substrate-binding protein